MFLQLLHSSILIQKVEKNLIPFSAQMHSKLHLPLPMRTQWFYTLWSRRSGLFSQPDLFYFVSTWTLPVGELEKLLAYVSCRCTITTNKKRTRMQHLTSVFHFYSLHDNIMFVHKVQRDWKKGIEGNSDKKLFQVHWQVTYLRSEKRLHCTLYLKLGRKQITAWTFLHSNPSVSSHCRLKHFHPVLSLYPTQALYLLPAILPQSISHSDPVTLPTSCC